MLHPDGTITHYGFVFEEGLTRTQRELVVRTHANAITIKAVVNEFKSTIAEVKSELSHERNPDKAP
jgi:hypothetical protein